MSDSSSLTEAEMKLANEAKQRALNILNDALRKKDSLLVDDPDKFGGEKKLTLFPLISTDLVKDLISQLQKVAFKKNEDPEMESFNAYVYPTTGTGIIYLCQRFWKLPEFLAISSRPKTLIHEVSHLLGYGHTIKENEDKVKMSQQYKLCPVSIQNIEGGFTIYMNHSGTNTSGQYSCCGETSQDTLCEKSIMSRVLKVGVWEPCRVLKGLLDADKHKPQSTHISTTEQ